MKQQSEIVHVDASRLAAFLAPRQPAEGVTYCTHVNKSKQYPYDNERQRERYGRQHLRQTDKERTMTAPSGSSRSPPS